MLCKLGIHKWGNWESIYGEVVWYDHKGGIRRQYRACSRCNRIKNKERRV